MTWARLVKHVARSVGVDLRRYNPRNSDAAKLQAMLKAFRIDLVIDVGANTGQYAESLREAGYAGQILSFEPLSAAHAQLIARSAHDPNWVVAERAAVSDRDGEIEINISANSVSSSILPMLSTHLASAPGSHYVGAERVPTVMLDNVQSRLVAAAEHIFLKIDTQGHEMAVLAGARHFTERIQGVQIEMSLVPLYEGQALMMEIIQELSARQFELWGLIPGFLDMSTGRQLQVDGIFFRSAT
jgi:FkbM family methyltransferase